MRFSGQYHDAETGLHYDFQRYYDPRIGRFIQQDPIGLAGGDNVYAYAPNPIGWVDPLGLACANVDAEGTLTIKNKFPPGSAEDAALKQHVADWNDQIQANGGSMTRQAVTPAMRASADEAAAAACARRHPGGLSQRHGGRPHARRRLGRLARRPDPAAQFLGEQLRRRRDAGRQTRHGVQQRDAQLKGPA